MDGGEMSASLVATPEKVDKAILALQAEFAKFANPGYFTEKELKAAQTQLEVSSTYAREKGQDFAVNLAFWWAIAGIDYFLDDAFSPTMKVSEAVVSDFVPFQEAPASSSGSAKSSAPREPAKTIVYNGRRKDLGSL